MSNDMVNTENDPEKTTLISDVEEEILDTSSIDISIPGASPELLMGAQNNETLGSNEPFSFDDLAATIFDIKKENIDSIPDSILDLSDVNEGDDDYESTKKKNRQITEEEMTLASSKLNSDSDEFLKYFFSKTEVSQEHHQLQETYKKIFSYNQPLLDKKAPVEIHAISHMQATWNLSGGIKLNQMNDDFSFKLSDKKEAIDNAMKFILQIASNTEQKLITTKDKVFFDLIKNYSDGFGVKINYIEEIKEESTITDNVVKFSQERMMKSY